MTTKPRFKVGDKVICRSKPSRDSIVSHESPGWCHEMDKCIGKAMEVNGVSTRGPRFTVKDNKWAWFEPWFRKATKAEIRQAEQALEDVKSFTPRPHLVDDGASVQVGMDEDPNGLWVQLHVYKQLEIKYLKLVEGEKP